MTRSTVAIARDLIAAGPGGLEDLRVHMFEGDEDPHDEQHQDRVELEFEQAFDQVRHELTAVFGEPSRTGDDDDDALPICGAFRFAVWLVNGCQLFAVAAHEDRECPYLLLLGTVDADA